MKNNLEVQLLLLLVLLLLQAVPLYRLLPLRLLLDIHGVDHLLSLRHHHLQNAMNDECQMKIK